MLSNCRRRVKFFVGAEQTERGSSFFCIRSFTALEQFLARPASVRLVQHLATMFVILRANTTLGMKLIPSLSLRLNHRLAIRPLREGRISLRIRLRAI